MSADLRALPGRLLMLGALAAAASGCRGTEIEDLIGRVSWFSNMREQPAVEPYEQRALETPDGTIPVDGMLPLRERPDQYDDVTNPMEVNDASLARGQELFQIYCAVCHGERGRGGSPLEGPYPPPLLPHLDTERARELTDGYIFGIMSVGRGLMPNYRRIPQADRWHIVNYVRALQVSPPDAETPTEPDDAP